jgi:serine/threonine-protein kinase
VNLIGQRIGSYVVERELGAGGTGTVYACRHTLIEREVAVKVLHDDQARDPEQVARFFQEAKAAAEIGHPNIIVIIDFGTLELSGSSRTYLMMESLDGESLDKRLRGRGLTLDEIAHVMSQIASALAACHAKGIIHRDLKPQNIHLCDRSFDPLFVKVLDFGTAKLTTPAPGVHRTQIGVVIGTPPYMSPEQCEGKGQIDHRSDIYSLGVILYQMLTGTLPFAGGLGEVMLAHMRTAPEPPSQRNRTVPPEWEALCLRMMEKQRERRFQSATELAHALDDLAGHAASYAAFRTRVAAEDLGHAQTAMVTPAPVEPSPVPTPEPRVITATSYAPSDPGAACLALATEPRHVAFARTLMVRPVGRWYQVAEVCRTGGVAPPAALPPESELYVSWTEHPHQDPSLAAVTFLSLRTGWSSVVLCPRARW